MNQRALGIAIIALFALCFVGSGAVAALTLLGRLSEAAVPEEVAEAAPEPQEPSEPLATAEPEEALEPEVDPEALAEELAEAEAEFEAPRFATAQFALFHSERGKLAPAPALARAARGTRLAVYQDKAPATARPPYLVHRLLEVEDYAVVLGQTLENGRGLSAAQKAALPKTTRVSVIDVVLPPEPAQLLPVYRALATFAEQAGGVLWDEQAQEYLALTAWKERRVNGWDKGLPQGPLHYSVLLSDADKGLTLETGGLAHFGLPELELQAVSRSSRDGAVSLVNALAQALLERPAAAKPGPFTLELSKLNHKAARELLQARALENAAQRLELELVPGRRAASLRITFPGQGSATERTERALGALFGFKDSVDKVEHDAVLDQLSKAQMELFRKTIKRRFRKGLQPGEVLLVKAPFETSAGGTEWMWVEVTAMRAGGKIDGLLSNDPDDVPELSSGSEVTVQESQLFDWMLQEADGSTTGNETGKLMLERLGR